MKKEFLKEIKNNIKDLMKENHFICEGQSYIRIVNKQILQIINFQGYSNGARFTLNIGIIPLCSVEFPFLPVPHICIGQLYKEEYSGWEYNLESTKKASSMIKENILPLLEKHSNYDNIYQELKSLVDSVPREEKDWNDPKVVIYYSIDEEAMFWVCLKNKDYSKCKVLLKNMKLTNSKWLKANVKNCEENIKNTEIPKYKNIFEENKNNFIEFANNKEKSIDGLEALLEKNKIDDLMIIAENIEQKNLKTFEKYII